MYQTTIARTVQLSGVGLHKGEEVTLMIAPAAAGTGVTFFAHTPQGVKALSPTPFAVQTTELATTLRIDNASLSTVEHLLAAINALQIDNVEIHVYGNEVPILDGSALPIVLALKEAGRKTLHEKKTFAYIRKPFTFTDGNKSISARPYDGLYIDYLIDFPHKSIGKQRLSIDITPETFEEIAFARTFGFLKEVEYMHSKGLALGGSLENAIVLDDNGVVNPTGLRSDDEFVRHKILDFIGDIAMFGIPLQGAFEVKYSGHGHNNLFLRELLKSQAFEISESYTKHVPQENHYTPGGRIAAYSFSNAL